MLAHSFKFCLSTFPFQFWLSTLIMDICVLMYSVLLYVFCTCVLCCILVYCKCLVYHACVMFYHCPTPKCSMEQNNQFKLCYLMMVYHKQLTTDWSLRV